MNRFLLTLGAFLLSLNILADNDVVFVDAQGQTIADRTVLTMNEATMNDFDEMEVALKGVYVKNTTASSVNVNMNAVVTSLPTGSFSCCLGTSCLSIAKKGTLSITGIALTAGETKQITSTEWKPTENSYGTCSVDLQLGTGSSVNGPKVTVNFVYTDPTGINNISADKAPATRKMLKDGRLFIVKNGRTFGLAGEVIK